MDSIIERLRRHGANDSVDWDLAQAMNRMTDDELAEAARELGVQAATPALAASLLEEDEPAEERVAELARGLALAPIDGIATTIEAFIADSAPKERSRRLNVRLARDPWFLLAMTRHHEWRLQSLIEGLADHMGAVSIEDAAHILGGLTQHDRDKVTRALGAEPISVAAAAGLLAAPDPPDEQVAALARGMALAPGQTLVEIHDALAGEGAAALRARLAGSRWHEIAAARLRLLGRG